MRIENASGFFFLFAFLFYKRVLQYKTNKSFKEYKN